jgi:hypothetical protein
VREASLKVLREIDALGSVFERATEDLLEAQTGIVVRCLVGEGIEADCLTAYCPSPFLRESNELCPDALSAQGLIHSQHIDIEV